MISNRTKYEVFNRQRTQHKEMPVFVIKTPVIKNNRIIDRGILYCGHEVINELVEHEGLKIKKKWFLCCTTQSHVHPDTDVSDLNLFSNLNVISDYLLKYPNVPFLNLGCGHFVDPQIFYKENSRKKYDAIYVAKWIPTKRVELFVDAAVKISHKKRGARFLLVGINILTASKKTISETYRNQIYKLVKESEAPIDIIESPSGGHTNPDGSFVPGGFTKNEIRSLINSAKVAVLCADTNEAINRFICESMCCDLPVVITKDTDGSIVDLVSPYSGALCDPSGTGIASSLRHVLDCRGDFSPRAFFTSLFGKDKAMKILMNKIKNISILQKREINIIDILKPYSGDIWSLDYYKYVNDK